MDNLTTEDIAFRLLAAVLLGMLPGLDREIKHKPLGLKEYMLVSLGAAGFTLATIEATLQLTILSERVEVDPIRAIQGIITGIGFLGAGAILHLQRRVRGGATGAGVWLVGAIGISCGMGFYWLAVMLSLLAVFILTGIGAVHDWYRRKYPSEQKQESRNP